MCGVFGNSRCRNVDPSQVRGVIYNGRRAIMFPVHITVDIDTTEHWRVDQGG